MVILVILLIVLELETCNIKRQITHNKGDMYILNNQECIMLYSFCIFLYIYFLKKCRICVYLKH